MFGIPVYGVDSGTIKTIAALLLVIGALVWGFGWKIYKLFIALMGGALCGGIAHAASGGQVGPALLWAIVGGILALLLMYVFVFLIGFATGAGISFLLATAGSRFPRTDLIPMHLIFGLIMGIIFIVAFKFIIVLMTSLQGSDLLISGSILLFEIRMSFDVYIALLILLTIAGIIFQYYKWGAPGDDLLKKNKGADGGAPVETPPPAVQTPAPAAAMAQPAAPIREYHVPAAAPVYPQPVREAVARPVEYATPPPPAPAAPAQTPVWQPPPPLPPPTPQIRYAPPPPAQASASAQPWLEPVQGGGYPIRLAVPTGRHSARYRIGREGDGTAASIVLADGTVSRSQALFDIEGNSVAITNLSATNPTRVNGYPIPDGTTWLLNEGDRVEFGALVYRFHNRI